MNVMTWLLPAIAVLLGAGITLFWNPTNAIRSVIQHFVAGIVLSAVALELLPELAEQSHLLALVLGFILGVMIMVGIRTIGHQFEDQPGVFGAAFALLFAVILDLFLDGFLIGISSFAGSDDGSIILFALAIEAFFLALGVAVSLRGYQFDNQKIALTSILLAAALCLGIFSSMLFIDINPFLWNLVLAFATVALLYLVTEELLVEAHEEKETSLTTSALFAGVLLVILLERSH